MRKLENEKVFFFHTSKRRRRRKKMVDQLRFNSQQQGPVVVEGNVRGSCEGFDLLVFFFFFFQACEQQAGILFFFPPYQIREEEKELRVDTRRVRIDIWFLSVTMRGRFVFALHFDFGINTVVSASRDNTLPTQQSRKSRTSSNKEAQFKKKKKDHNNKDMHIFFYIRVDTRERDRAILG